MKKLIIITLCAAAILLAACSVAAIPEPAPSATIGVFKTPVPPSPTPVPTVPPETPVPTSAVTAVIEVKDGDTLERDIIPQVTAAFSMTEDEVKNALAEAESSLIGKAKSFRRMEGMIVPGTYEVKGEDLKFWINKWIGGAQQRYDRIAESVPDKNSLSEGERIILASVVEGDTNLVDSYESAVANVYSNRIKKKDTFGSCPTVEYALGYQRPYLLKTDIEIDSEYNTYTYKGLPPGPICCFDDESLAASIAEYSDKKLYFFFYDYVKKEIMSFTSYDDFKAAVKESRNLYESTIDPDRFIKMDDKREYFN